MKTHKIGATLAWGGPIRIDSPSGRSWPDLSGWTATATLRGRRFKAALACALAREDGKTILYMSATPAEQAGWRGGDAVMDVRLASPEGFVLVTRTAMLKLADPVTT
jgi:hypothetical protein